MQPLGVLYAQAGNGHRSAALAIREALSAPAALVDLLGFAPSWFRALFSRGYETLGERAHRPCEAVYRVTDRLREESALVRVLDRVSTGVLEPFRRFVEDNPFREILCTHFLPLPLLARLRAEGLYRGRLSVCVTDFGLHRFWVHPEVDRYFCASTSVAQQLADHRVPPERIRVTGIPVRRAFRELHRNLRRPGPASPLRVLFCASSIPERQVLRVLETLGGLGIPLRVCLVAGRSRSLLEKLRDYRPSPLLDLTRIGYASDLPQRMREADLLVTKPGGLVASEALCAGLPLVLTSPIPLQETLNARYLESVGAGHLETEAEGVARRIAWYREDPSRVIRASERALAAARPEAARNIAQALEEDFRLPGLPRIAPKLPEAVGA